MCSQITKWLLMSIAILINLYSGFINCQSCTPLSTWPVVKSNWSNCSVFSDGPVTINNVYAECMFLNVPIDWNSNNLTTCTQTIEIFVKRYFLSGYQNISHHLWRLPGGGGVPISAAAFEAVSVVSALNGSVSIYATDKRGVGQSSFLECPTSIVENFTACLPYIQENEYRLKQNTFTNTAHDLEHVLKVVMGINRENLKPNQRVVLMPSSQSTYLMQRYLQVTENAEQVDAVIFDSVLPSDTPGLIHVDEYINYIFLDLFTRCSQDIEGCAKYFEDNNPMRALYTYKMNEDFPDNSSCLYLLKTNTTYIAQKVSLILSPERMQLLPALIYRINRCNIDDQIVLKRFLNVTQAPPQDQQPGFSILVEINNIVAELWSPFNTQGKNPSCEYLKGLSMNTFAAQHVILDIYCPIQQTGVLGYPTDQYFRKYPTKKTKLPVLLLTGDMDQALPLPVARHFVKQYSMINSNLTYIEMPRTGHTPLNAAPMTDEERGGCGWNLALSFILSPTFEPDRSCLKKILPIDFAGTSMRSKQSAMELFGTDNVWGTEKANETIANAAINIQYTFSIIIVSLTSNVYRVMINNN